MAAKNKKAVVVAGLRTPFVKAFGEFLKLDTIALGRAAVTGLLERTGLARREVDSIVWGGVVLPSSAPNIAREIALDAGLPHEVEGVTVSQACASGLRAITTAAAAIERGDAEVVIAGGSDSTSNAELQVPQKVVHALAPFAFGKAKPRDILGVLAQLWPLHEIVPKAPRIAERTTGKTMGQSCEDMARRNNISRQAQDEFALTSHLRAAQAIASGRLADEIQPVATPQGGWVHSDGLVRAKTTLEQLSRLSPVFARDGTLTAGNSSPLTDGASAVLLMSPRRAKALGYTPLARLAAWHYVGVDPADQLLIGPALAIPQALDWAGYTLADMDFVDLHEAFAAQVLCVTRLLGSRAFADARLGRAQAVGDIDPERLNVHGGSISLGHPFGATGARMVTTMANELHHSGRATALVGLCAAGGLGAAAVLEHP
jgi:acetyl-CoA acyltransferase